MSRIFVIVLIVILVGSYMVPASLIVQVPYGTEIQRVTKQAVAWSITKVNELFGEKLSEVFQDIKNQAKDSIKDAAKEQIDKRVDEVLP